MVKLKVLVERLLRGTVDRRRELDRIRASLDGLSNDYPFLAGVERDVNWLVISSGLADRQVAARRVEAGLLSRAAAEEEQARSLQAEVDSLAEELRSVGVRSEMVAGEEDEFKNALARVLQEKETSLKDLDRKEKELRAFKAQVRELEIGTTEAVASLERLEIEIYDLVELEKEREEALHSLRLKKASMATSLDECWQSLESLESKMEEEVKIKQEEVEKAKAKKEAIAEKVSGLEAERQILVENNQRPEAEVDGLKAAIKKVSTLESEIQSLLEKTLWLGVDLDVSKPTVELGFLKEEEKEGILIDYEKRVTSSLWELYGLKTRLGEIEREKDAIEVARAGQKSEIDTSQEELQQIQSTILELQDLQALYEDYTSTNAQLHAERDYAWRVLDLQLEEGRLRSRIEELNKRNNEVEEQVQWLQRALNDFAEEEE